MANLEAFAQRVLKIEGVEQFIFIRNDGHILIHNVENPQSLSALAAFTGLSGEAIRTVIGTTYFKHLSFSRPPPPGQLFSRHPSACRGLYPGRGSAGQPADSGDHPIQSRVRITGQEGRRGPICIDISGGRFGLPFFSFFSGSDSAKAPSPEPKRNH